MVALCLGGPIDGEVLPVAPSVEVYEVEFLQNVPYRYAEPSTNDRWEVIPTLIARYERVAIEGEVLFCVFLFMGDSDVQEA